jgi:hypothetical protein
MDKEPIVYEDSVISAILQAKGHIVKAKFDESTKRVVFEIFGDVIKSLKEIHNNEPIGSRDVLMSMKNCRTAIFAFKEYRPVGRR